MLEPSDDCGYVGTSLEMPLVAGDGKTADACVEAVREALIGAIAYLMEEGKDPPLPADSGTSKLQEDAA